MKRTTLINLICAMTAAVVVIIAVILGLIFTGVLRSEEQRTIVISSSSATATYDGTPLVDTDWHLAQGELKEGHMLTVKVTGSQTSVGMSENHLSATVRDVSGADVTSDYIVEYKPGVLNVKSRDICIVADSDMKKYDETPLTAESYDLREKSALISGDVLTVTVEGIQTEVGESANKVTGYRIDNSEGEDVTRNYNVTTEDGKLIVYDKDAIVIKTDDDVKEYDGFSLKNSNWSLVNGELIDGDYLEVEVTGYRVNAGKADNAFTARIFNKDGEDITDTGKYIIKCIPGSLDVLPRSITITSNDDTRVYNGEPLTNDGYYVSPSEFAQGIVISGIEVTGSITGSANQENSTPNTIVGDAIIYDGEGKDITDNFVVDYVEGTLTVTPSEESTAD